MCHSALEGENLNAILIMKRLIFFLMAMAAIGAVAQTDRTMDAGAEEEVFAVVEQDPEFEGGMEGLYQYLATSIVYPAGAREEGVQGRVFVSFVIEKDGSVGGVKILRSPDERLSREAERVVKSMPKWKPGRQNGRKVRVLYSLPINFQLNNEKKD